MDDIIQKMKDIKDKNTTIVLSLMFEYFNSWKKSSDDLFLIIMGIVVFLMQCGFAFLEAGSVRSRNTTNTLMKNVIDSFICAILFYMFGYALAFGEPGNPFCGQTYWAMSYMPKSSMPHWFCQFVYAVTASTIVSGAVAERCKFVAYIIFSGVMSAFIYPIVAHWVWSQSGWLAVGISTGELTSTFQDFAGSGVVHMVGGTAAFVGALLLGPRIGRFDPGSRNPIAIQGHSVPLTSLGGCILFFAFFAFNAGSVGSISKPGDGQLIATAVINTILCGSASGFVVLLVKVITNNVWSLLELINGSLVGMVAICAGANVFTPYISLVMGFFAGFIYLMLAWLVLCFKIDDPLNAVAVHFGGGLWGLLGVTLFDPSHGIVYNWNALSGLYFAWQLIGILAIISWVAFNTVIIFGALTLMKVFRVDLKVEEQGLDIAEHGEPAYASEASVQVSKEIEPKFRYLNTETAYRTEVKDYVNHTITLEDEISNKGQTTTSINVHNEEYSRM